MALIKGKQIAQNSVQLNRLPKQDAGKILVGQGNQVDLEFKALSQDATIDSTGALTISNGAVSEAKIADLAVSTNKLQDQSVSTAKIADLSVEEGKLANSSVTETKLADLSVSTAKLQASAVETDKIADFSVTFGKLNGDVWSNAGDLSDLGKLPTSAAVIQYISDNTTAIGDTDALDEGVTNLYFTEARAQTAVVQNDLTASIVKAPSVDAIVGYVDTKFETAVQGLDFHAACKTASDVNVNILVPGPTINGFTFTANGQRVLLKDQAEPKENGIYDWHGEALPLTRSGDSDNSPEGEVTGGMLTFIEAGNLAGTSWVLNSPAGVVDLGNIGLTFVQFSSGAAYVAGSAITINGLTIALDLSQLNDVGALAKEDKLSLIDASDSNAGKLVSVSDIAAFLADTTTITATDGKLSVVPSGGETQRDITTTPSAVAANATGSTGLTISATPAQDGFVQVFINGIMYNLGAATNSEVFFSDDAGETAKTIANIASGDTLFFCGSTCGHSLETDDVIQLVYQI
jgi:hypothetical protein